MTPPDPYLWIQSTDLRVTLPYQSEHLGCYGHSFHCELPSQTLPSCYMFTVSRMTPSQILYLRSHVFSPQGDLFQALYLGSHIQSLPCAFFQTQYLVTHVHSLRGDVISQTLYLGNMSTVSSVNPQPDPAPGVICPHSPLLHPPVRPCTWCPVSRVMIFPRLYIWGHTSTFSRVTQPH